MRKIIPIVIGCVVGALLLIGGSAFAVFMHSYYTPNFDKYSEQYAYVLHDDYEYTEEMIERYRAEKRIKYPSYMCGVYDKSMFAAELIDCYDEIDSACRDYATLVASKYNNEADLNYTVENENNRLTIKFTGAGYPEGGEPEELSRTYIFDIEGVGADKLPRLINRAEFIGY